MSLCSTDPEFVFALRTKGDNRTERELNVIYSRLNRMEILSSMREQSLRGICTLVRYEKHDANEILYRKDDACRCWYILMSGSVFIQGSMFLPHACFGKQIPGTKRRGCQCLVLESSEMIAIDYPDMAIHSSGMTSRPHAMLRHDTGHHSPRGALDSVAEVDTSSAESSPLHQSRSNSMHKSSNGQIMVGGDNVSQFSKDTEEMDDYSEQDLEEEDSISLHSSSSIIIKDLVIDVLKKDISDRNGDDLEILLEFTKSLQAFSNLTEPIRRALCKVMVFAWVEKAGTVVLKDNELLDSWSVIINGNVQVRKDGTEEDVCLSMGDSFGVQPTLQPQQHNGVMYTMCDDCQFLCIAQPEYCQVLHQGQENIQNVYNEAGDLVMVKEKREFEGGTKIGNIVIRGNADSLMHHLLEENSIDTTYTEDFLLTYRAFNNDPLKISNKLLEWFDNVMFRDKVIRVILLWINNHFNDFECDWRMMNVLEKFEEKLHQANLHGQTKLFNIACTAKAQARTVTITRPSSEAELCFQILGGSEKNFPIYISSVLEGSEGETKGVKRGDLLLEVNGQNFEKLTLEKATAILKKNTELRLTLKTSLFAFKEMVSELSNPQKKKKHKTDEKNIFFPPGQRGGRMSLTMMSETDAFDQKHKKEAPEDVIKVYKADQTHKFLFVNRDTTAGDAVQSACKEFGITEDLKDYALYRVSVQGEKFVKQSKLPDPLSKLADIPLGSRYYLKNTMNSEQLLPDEQIPDLLKEANFSFLDLNCFEVAVFLTRKDYKMFQATASTDFIEDLFHLDAELTQFKAFEDLVNRELFWVVTTLCNEPNLIQRSKIIKHFVKIAHHCKILKNLNSTFALISGLGYRAVSRMKQTWEKVPAKSNRLFEELQALMDPSRNMSKYRTLLNEMVSQPPVIPYIPVIKKDLTFLDLGNDTKVEGLINFEKMRMIGKEVRNVCRLCAPDSTQILPSAAAQQRESEKGSQNPIYLTLARRGRRSSFNNVRRLYEDQINVRRVKQYMQSIEVVSDEDKLMEMSKAVESVIPSASNQQKRRNTTASLPSDSPSRSSKTLPAFPLRTSSNGSSSSLHSRNNSEPQLAAVPVIALHPTRKKMPVSSLPKFGANSPQALRKLLSLSEEGGGNDKTGGKKLGTRRNGSVSSHDLSPATSPYMSPKRREDAQHSVANENINRNNNRLSLPTGVVAEPPSPSIQSAPINSRKFFPPGGSSATSSSRSSIASASSLGTVSSSNPTHSSLSSLGGSSSPRSSSPVGWGQSGGTTGPQLGSHPSHTHYHQQGRTSSSSSADTVKSGAGRHHERPVIKQTRNGRSSSFGGGGMMSSAMMSSIPDRRMNQMSSSTSTPSLSAPGSHQPLILPNHPQMPRTPSIDSGIVSVGSISSDSTRFNPSDDAEIFGRVHHHPGHQRQHPGRHLDQLHHRINEQSQLSPHLRHGRSNPPPQLEEEDKVEQTFLSGFRGHGDTPRPDTKVPSNFYPQSVTHVDHGGHPGEPMTIYGHVPPGQSRPMYMMPRNFGKSGVKGIHDYLICERHAMMRSRQIYANHHITYHRPEPVKTPEALLEDQLVLELQKQRPQLQRHKNSTISEDSNLSDKLSKSDPALNVPYPNPYEDPRIRLPPPARTSSPKSMIKQASLPHPSPLSPCNDNVFSHNHSYHTPIDSRSSFSTPNHSRPHITPPYPQNTPTSTPNTSRNIPARAEDPSLNWQYPSRDPPIPRPTTLNTTSPYLNYSAQHGESALQDPITPQYDPHSNQYELYPIPVDMTPNSSIITTPHLPHSTQVPQHLINGSPGPQLRRKTSQDWNETDLDGEKNQQTMKAWGSSASLPATPLTSKSNNPQNPLPPHTLQPTLLHGSSISALTVTSKTKKPAPAPPQRTSSFARSRQLRISSTTSPTSESPPLSPLTPTKHCSLDVSTTCNGWMGNGHVITNGYTPSETRVAPLERRSLPTYTEAVNQINLKQSRFPAPLNNYRSFNIDAHENTEQVSQV